MAGGGSGSVGPTEHEVELAKVAQANHEVWKETGIPLENEYIRRTTGYKLDEETGEYMIDEGGILNADGSARIDTSTARVANEQAMTNSLKQVDPNRLEQVEGANRESSAGAAGADMSMGLGQQDAARAGLVNAAQYGQGKEQEDVQRKTELAQQAQSDAMQNAQSAENKRAMTGSLLGTAIGAGTAMYQNKPSALDRLQSPSAGARRKLPGDQHEF